MKSAIKAIFVFAVVVVSAAAQSSPASMWQKVEKALGRTGEEKEGVFRVAFPRSDMHVKVDLVEVRTGVALGSWAAFQKNGAAAMMMGDLVLLASEVPGVVAKLNEGGVEITAIHNHLMGEEPRVMYLHYHGQGQAEKLAATLREALATTATPPPVKLAVEPSSKPSEEIPAPKAERLSQILGRKGTARAGVVSFSIPRAQKLTGGGAVLGPRMGVATAINIQLTNDGGAAASGDFVLLASEVQPVIKALRTHGIQITALHNHMLDDQPRLFFLHFWGHQEAEMLAAGLRAALEVSNYVREP